MVSDKAIIFHMCIPGGNPFSLVQRLWSSVKVNV